MAEDIKIIKDVIDAMCRQAALIPLEDAQKLVAEFERTNALMPLLDPTAYMGIVDNIGGHERIAKAFLTFRLELEAVKNSK